MFSVTYVKLTLMSPNGQEIARSKTSIRRGQPNPLYKETFMFQVALFQLPDVTLMTSVYNKRSMKRKEMIGWFSLGTITFWKDSVQVLTRSSFFASFMRCLKSYISVLEEASNLFCNFCSYFVWYWRYTCEAFWSQFHWPAISENEPGVHKKRCFHFQV